MARVFVVYHSGYGHTKAVAEAVAGGAGVSGVDVAIYDTEKAAGAIDEFDGADAIIMGCPTYMGGPSTDFKKFADATSKKWLQRKWLNKLAAGFTNSGGLSGDKLSTLYYIYTFAMQHGMIWVGQSEVPPPVSDGRGPLPEHINRMSSFTGLMTQSDNAGTEITPPSGDIETARIFGRRVARAAQRWMSGQPIGADL